MNKTLCYGMAAVVLLLLAGCVPFPLPTKHVYKEGYEIQVLGTETQRPVANVSITLHYARNGDVFDYVPQRDKHPVTETATTDENGYIRTEEASHISLIFIASMAGGADVPGPSKEHREKYGATAYYNSYYSFIPYTLFKIEIIKDGYEPFTWEIETFKDYEAPTQFYIKAETNHN